MAIRHKVIFFLLFLAPRCVKFCKTTARWRKTLLWIGGLWLVVLVKSEVRKMQLFSAHFNS